MPTAGPNAPSTATDDSSIGTISWTNAANAAGTSAFATAAVAASAATHYIKGAAFGFSIPGGQTILGITATIQGKSTVGSGIKDNSIRLIKSGVIQSTNRANGQLFTGVNILHTLTWGGTSDLWGGTWVSTDINNAGFGVAYSFISNTKTLDTLSVNTIQLTITYGSVISVTSDGICYFSNIQSQTCQARVVVEEVQLQIANPRAPFEDQILIAANPSLQLENYGKILKDSDRPFESIVSTITDGILPLTMPMRQQTDFVLQDEFLGGVTTHASGAPAMHMFYETLKNNDGGVNFLDENVLTQKEDSPIQQEIVKTNTANPPLPFTLRQTQQSDGLLQNELESGVLFLSDHVIPLETQLSAQNNNPAPIEDIANTSINNGELLETIATQNIAAAAPFDIEGGVSFLSDHTVPLEFYSLLVKDKGYPFENIKQTSNDNILPDETLQNITTAIPAPLEIEGGVAFLSDHTTPLEILGGVQEDSPAQLETYALMLADTALPDEILASNAENIILPDETIKSTISDANKAFSSVATPDIITPSPFDVGSSMTVKTNIVGPLEFNQTPQADNNLPLELDSNVTFLLDHVAPIELIGNSSTDSIAPLESLISAIYDEETQAEILAGQLLDSNALLDLEGSVTFSTDHAAPLEILGSTNFNSTIPLELLNQSSITFDGVLPLDFSAGIISDYPLPIETYAAIIQDIPALIEALPSILADYVLPLETAHAIAFMLDTPLPLEWLANFVVDAPIFLETVQSSIGDSLLPAEITLSVSIDARALFETILFKTSPTPRIINPCDNERIVYAGQAPRIIDVKIMKRIL